MQEKNNSLKLLLNTVRLVRRPESWIATTMVRKGELQLQERRTMEFRIRKLTDGVKEMNLLTLLMDRLRRHLEHRPVLRLLRWELLLLLVYNDKGTFFNDILSLILLPLSLILYTLFRMIILSTHETRMLIFRSIKSQVFLVVERIGLLRNREKRLRIFHAV